MYNKSVYSTWYIMLKNNNVTLLSDYNHIIMKTVNCLLQTRLYIIYDNIHANTHTKLQKAY